ncbi:MAG: acetate--CoA ligase family protein [Archaeoglobus sp.]|nr:acetate--CoA ligase family protein [Archaeoglobus sp.]
MMLMEHEAKELLKDFGINVNPTFLAKNEDEAVRIAKELGFPVVLKVASSKISHKSDVGGVILNVTDENGVIKAFRRLKSIPNAEGVSVQPMAKKGIEIIVGVVRDEQFGHAILFGAGGLAVELYKDVSFRVLPVNEREIREMIEETKVSKLLKGFRGMKGDLNAVIELIMKIEDLVKDKPEIKELDLNPVFVYDRGYSVVDGRIVFGEGEWEEEIRKGGIEKFFYPESVAVFGSFKIGKAAFTILYNLVNLKYKGRIYPVSLQGDEIFGIKIYRSLDELPETPDIAVVATPAASVPELILKCARKGVKNAIIISSGFREEGEEGAKLEDRILEIAKEYGMRIVGPNTTGILNPENGFTSSFAILQEIKQGGIGIIAQTGLFLGILMNHIASSHPAIGFSKIAGLGNKCDVQDHEILEFMLEDGKTKAVGIYAEGFKHGKEFLRVARKALSLKKPLVVFKSGITDYGKRMALSHSASLAGDDRIFDAICKQLNLVRVFSYEEMLETLKAFYLQPLPKGNRVAILHYVGSGCVQGADEAYLGGLSLPEFSTESFEKISRVTPEWHRVGNPFDIWPSIEFFGVEEAYNTTIQAALEDENFDSIIVGTWAVGKIYPNYIPPFDLLKEYVEKYEKPIYFFIEGDRNAVFELKNEYETNGFPVFPDIATTIRILSRVVRYSLDLSKSTKKI